MRARQRRTERHQPHAVLTARRHRRLFDLPRLRRRLPRLDLAFGIAQRPAERFGVRGLAPQPLTQFGGHLLFGVERGGELVACGAELAGEPRAVAQRGVRRVSLCFAQEIQGHQTAYTDERAGTTKSTNAR